MKKKLLILTMMAASLYSTNTLAQGSPDYGTGMKLNIDKEGTKNIRFIFWNQVWLRSVDNNPGTLVNGNQESSTWDIGARRLRFLAIAQISPRYLILTHVGINNQTFLNGGAAGTAATTGGYGPGKKPGLFFHDAWNEYAVLPAKKADGSNARFSLYLGAGLHYWNGISRMTSASTLNFLTVDAPIFNWPLIENSDQFARQFGVYIKGRFDKVGYQFHLNKPFATNTAMNAAPNIAVDRNTGKSAYGGYVDYQFLDQESNVLPFRVGTYMGTKKVFNIGAGFYQNTEGTESWADTNAATKTAQKHDILLYSVDAFADLPVGNKERGMAVTAYSVFYNYDFGPNYLRSIGIMNTGTLDPTFTGTRAAEGAGDARYAIGTGGIWYTQAGFLLPKQISKKVRFQPFGAIALKNFDALQEQGSYWDIGANAFIDGHHAKLTAQYSSRPIYDNASKKVFDRKGEFILQFQVYL
jgi:hypothetical protein